MTKKSSTLSTVRGSLTLPVLAEVELVDDAVCTTEGNDGRSDNSLSPISARTEIFIYYYLLGVLFICKNVTKCIASRSRCIWGGYSTGE